MPATINLMRMSVIGWKAIQQELEIEFNGESWLIHGENEVGKSSIFSALRCALFEDPDTNGAWADSWVNNDSAEAVIEVELLIDGEPFTIIKNRSAAGNGNIRLFEGIGATRIQRSTGRDAVIEILELVGARPRSGRGDEIPSDWGILAWLLAPQGMDSVSSARDQGTQTLGLERAISEQMVEVEEALKDSIRDELTNTGRPKTGGTYRVSIDDMARAAQTVQEVDTRRVSYTELLQEVGRKEDDIIACENRLEEEERELETLRGSEIDLTVRDGDINTLRAQKDAKQAEVDAASTAIDNLEAIEKELASHKQDVLEAVGEIKLKSEEKNSVDAILTEKTELIESTRERHQKTTESIDAKNSQIVAATQIQQRDELQGKIDSLDEIDVEVAELEAQGPIIDDETLDGMNNLAVRLERAEGMLSSLSESRGTSVEVEGKLEASWEVDGQATEVESETRFAQQLKIEGEGFSINLNRELDDDTDWTQERAEARSELDAHGVSSAEELRSKERMERQKGESMRAISQKKSILGNRDAIAEQLGKLSDVQELSEDAPDIEVLRAEVSALEDERDELKEQIEALEVELEKIRKQRQDLGGDLGDLRAREEAAKALESSCDARRVEEIGTGGTMEMRKDNHSERTDQLTDLTEQLNDLKGLRDTEYQAQRDDIIRARKATATIEKELRNLKAELIALNNQGDDHGGAELQRGMVDARNSLNDAERAKERIESRVHAEQRLLTRFERALTDATELEVGPIRDQVQTWLGRVTLGKWTGMEMDSRLNVTALHGPNRSINGEEVGSWGLQQLIHALIRLSVACKIHGDKAKAADNPEFPAVALVMDESQAHISDGRVVRLMGIFNGEIKAGRVQIIALSHRMTEFQSLYAINYNVERREATDLRDID